MENILHCSLCKDFVQSTELNLKTLKSKLSNTPLILFIEKIVGAFNSIASHCTICLNCHDLINELDAIELRQREIHSLLKMYVEREEPNTYNGHKKVKTEDDDLSNIECCAVSEISDLNLDIKDLKNNEMPRKINYSKEMVEIKVSDITECQADLKNECSEIIRTGTSVELVNIKKHVDIGKLHKCKCSKTFRTLWELKSHMKSHNDYQRFICHICGLSYKHQTAFSRHMDTHNGINPFTCIYCNKSFTQKGALVRHVPLHTGEKPYQCDKCGKRFVHHTSFNMHRLSHTGEKSHKCNVCGLALMSASHLKRHMRIHTGEKKFVCNICGKRFAERYNLVAHEKLHSNPKSTLSVNMCYSRQIKEENTKWLNDDAQSTK